ncbi:MAG: phage holin family protein [Mollicutes bacterium]|nr:phage holin family protein [Mollicutes bacterium]
MKMIIINGDGKKRINSILDWLIYMCGYALVLISVSVIFDNTIYIDNSYFGLWALIAVIIIYILNKTIKPIIVWLTLPITGLTLGLFYPFINVFILNIVDFILGKYFEIKGIFMGVIVAIIISIMNILMENLIIEPLLRKGR